MSFTITSVGRDLAQNPLTVFNTLLLIFTGSLSYASYVFQKQTSIRESLEQLEDADYRFGKLRPMLHEFGYIPFRHCRVVVQLKYYQFGTEPSTAGEMSELFDKFLYRLNGRDSSHPDYPREELESDLERTLSNAEYAESVDVNSQGILLTFNTLDAVLIRKNVNQVLQEIHDLRTNDLERWKEEVGSEE